MKYFIRKIWLVLTNNRKQKRRQQSKEGFMEICYYPGCTLKTQAKELDVSARKAMAALGVTMKEIENWQCCGAVYPTAKWEIATRLSAIRTLEYAREHGGKLLTLCSACHNVIKRTNEDIKTDEHFATAANVYLAFEKPYLGETKVVHYLEFLRDEIGISTIKSKVVKPLNRKIATYYGCLLLRPSKVMAFDNPENPSILEDFIRALGGTSVIYPFRNECCGAYLSVKNPDLTHEKSKKVLCSAKQAGAEQITTSCPLCYYNLKENGENILPVLDITALLCEALGIEGYGEKEAAQ